MDIDSTTLMKIAKCTKFKKDLIKAYRKVSGGLMLKKDIPIIRSLPESTEKAKETLIREISRSSDSWSHPQVAVKNLDLKRLGFKPTRIAIPLPGERLATKTYRAGRLHAHKFGDMFLVHADSSAPNSIRAFFKHTIEDTSKALKTMRNALPPVLKDC